MTWKLTPDRLYELEEAARFSRGYGKAHYLATIRPTDVLALITEVRELRAKVELVREVHQKKPDPSPLYATGNGPHFACSHCTYQCDSDAIPEPWPCDTVKALGEEA